MHKNYKGRSSNQKKLSESLQDYIKTNKNLTRSMQKHNIRDVWKEVVGELVDGYTEKLRIHQKELIVKVRSAALRQELSFSKTTLLEKLNQLMPYDKLEDISIR